MELLDSYFPYNTYTKKILLSILESTIVDPLKNLDIKNNNQLSICQDAFIKCLTEIAKSNVFILAVEKSSFYVDLSHCLQATRVLMEYNETKVCYKNVIQETIEDTYEHKEPCNIAILSEITGILTFLQWKKGIR